MPDQALTVSEPGLPVTTAHSARLALSFRVVPRTSCGCCGIPWRWCVLWFLHTMVNTVPKRK